MIHTRRSVTFLHSPHFAFRPTYSESRPIIANCVTRQRHETCVHYSLVAAPKVLVVFKNSISRRCKLRNSHVDGRIEAPPIEHRLKLHQPPLPPSPAPSRKEKSAGHRKIISLRPNGSSRCTRAYANARTIFHPNGARYCDALLTFRINGRQPTRLTFTTGAQRLSHTALIRRLIIHDRRYLSFYLHC